MDADAIKQIVLMGSNCSYTYTDNSDLDAHIIVYDSKFKTPETFRKLFDYYKSYFTKTYDVSIKGVDLQLYIQFESDFNASMGIYDILQNKWISKPQKKDNIQVDVDYMNMKYQSIMNSIKANYNNLESLVKIKDKIKSMRKKGLQDKGQYSEQNLLFKRLRNSGALESLHNRIIYYRSLQMSLQQVGNDRDVVNTNIIDENGYIYHKDYPFVKIKNNGIALSLLSYYVEQIQNIQLSQTNIVAVAQPYFTLEASNSDTVILNGKQIPYEIMKILADF